MLVWAMGIIATEKANLRTELAVAVNRVREQELRFYSTSLNVIGTEATLLVGLAFAMIAGWEPILPYEGYLPLNWSTAIGITNRHDYIGEGGIPHWDWSDYLTQILQVAYLCVSMYTTIRLLSIVQMCVFSEFRGVGLALRGPDGSLQSAVHKLQRQVEFQAMGIRRALWSLGIAIFLLVVVRLPWIVGIPTCLASMPWAYRALKRDTFIDETCVAHALPSLYLRSTFALPSLCLRSALPSLCLRSACALPAPCLRSQHTHALICCPWGWCAGSSLRRSTTPR